MGGYQQEGREAEDLGRRSPSPPRRVRGAAAPSTLEDTPSGAPATGGGREGGGSGVRVRVRGWRSREPGRGPDRMFFSFVFFLLFVFSGRLGRRRSGSPARIGNAGLGRDKVIFEKPAAAMIQWGRMTHTHTPTPSTTTRIARECQDSSWLQSWGAYPAHFGLTTW